jgi:hypothetical protein
MTMEKGSVQQLLYQLYTSLNRKKKRNLTGTAMETMTAPATKILAQAETQQYQNVCFFGIEYFFIDYEICLCLVNSKENDTSMRS